MFKIDGLVVETLSIVYGQAVTAPDAPEREGHTFAGWQDIPATMPAHDIEIEGTYTINSYNAVFKIDGLVVETLNIVYGQAVTAPDAPEREGHTFAGWQGIPATMPAHDIEIEGIYTINSYWLNLYLNEELYYSEEIQLGNPVVISDPVIPDGTKFEGWDEEIPVTMPAHDVNLHGKYSIIDDIASISIEDSTKVTICKLDGFVLYRNVLWKDVLPKLKSGLYVINGIKCHIKK